MAITKTWEINTLQRDLSDGFVTKVIYRVKGISDSEEKARETGQVIFEKPESLPSDFIEFAKLDAATVLGWVKTKLNEEKDKDGNAIDKVANIETVLEAKVNEVLTPTTASGVPW
tara:strand:- start:137 stop:481 length:345 start_codon:yes stop_codon:yes gene_type:complete